MAISQRHDEQSAIIYSDGTLPTIYPVIWRARAPAYQLWRFTDMHAVHCHIHCLLLSVLIQSGQHVLYNLGSDLHEESLEWADGSQDDICTFIMATWVPFFFKRISVHATVRAAFIGCDLHDPVIIRSHAIIVIIVISGCLIRVVVLFVVLLSFCPVC